MRRSTRCHWPIALLLLATTSCIEENTTPHSMQWQGWGYYATTDAQVLSDIMPEITCQGQLGPNRVISRLRTTGNFHNGVYFGGSPLRPGELLGAIEKTYLGVSPAGDLIVVQTVSSGEAYIFLHLCQQKGLVVPERKVAEIKLSQARGIVLIDRPECKANEVQAPNIEVVLDHYYDQSQDLDDISIFYPFAGADTLIPELCQLPVWQNLPAGPILGR